MKRFSYLLVIFPMVVEAQKIELKPVDIIYGKQIIHSHHQIVTSTPDSVAVIPVQKEAETDQLGPNVVIGSSDSSLSYLEEVNISKREQAIYDEVNKRTREAPFTVLFTGNIPDQIQEKRLRMMPEIGMEREREDGSSSPYSPDAGAFSPVGQDITSENYSYSMEEELEKLIGGDG